MWELIEQAMMKKGLKPSVSEFRKLTGFSSLVAAKIRKNQKNIRYETFRIICEKLELEPSDLLNS